MESLNSKFKIQNSKLEKLAGLLLAWFAHNARDLPWRHTYDPYAIWISEIMLQQTQVKTVIPYWERWMRAVPTVQALARARPEKILKLWEGLGYYTRARNLHRAARLIVNEHNSKFPTTFDEILALPGIGRYTAGAICSIAFNQPTPVLDGNVIRVLTRIFGIENNPKEKATNAKLWALATALVENSKFKTQNSKLCCSHLNQSLMELGAVLCVPRSPNCAVCPVRKLCVAHCEGRQEELPNLGRRAAATQRRFIAFVVESDGKFLVRRRPAGVVNAHLWEFPNVEVSTRTDRARHSARPARAPSRQVRAAVRQFQTGAQGTDAPCLPAWCELTSAEPFCTIKHSITRFRITLEAYRAKLKPPIRSQHNSAKWLAPEKLNFLAFTSAHRKILKRLETTH